MNRRNLLYTAAAATAGISGATVAWLRHQPQQVATVPISAAQDALWAMSFDSPDGQPKKMSDFRGKPLLLNFWATWCPPCVEELPLLDAFYQSQKGKNWQVFGLAIDQPSAVRKWLKAKPLNFAVGIAGLSGTELSKSLGNLAGSLPFTAVFGATGEMLHRKVGKISQEDLMQWALLR